MILIDPIKDKIMSQLTIAMNLFVRPIIDSRFTGIKGLKEYGSEVDFVLNKVI